MGVSRTTFVVDATDGIARVFEKVKADGRANAVADAVRVPGWSARRHGGTVDASERRSSPPRAAGDVGEVHGTGSAARSRARSP